MERELNSKEFDSFLGGSQKVPSGISLTEFIKNRLEEVVMLTETIKESPFKGQTFQRLPKHMRRRQMSHYIKRLPRRLQRPFLMSLKEGLPPPTKCPSRKHRRRPENLLLEYNRRQKKSIWLETHIWHAKRFHMTENWGYKLPEKPVNKSFRACYRAVSENCLLVDISYYNCIELKGYEAELLEGLKKCNSPNCGLTFGAKMYMSGSREGLVTLFHPNSYPYRVIGNVTFMWEPVSCDSKSRTIWIWVHPLIHDETIECFKGLFGLSDAKEKSNKDEGQKNVESLKITDEKERGRRGRSKMKIEQIKLKPKNVPFVRTPKYTNKNETITMTLLKDTLNRFQLTGPLSQAIISQVFSLAVTFPPEKNNQEVDCIEVAGKKRRIEDVEIMHDAKKMKTSKEEYKRENWWEEYYKDDTHREVWRDQRDFYQKLANCLRPTDIPPGVILSLVVEDPRLRIPSKREKTAPCIKEPQQISECSVNGNLSRSPIWNPRIRDQVSINKLTTQEINELRTKKIVPGFDIGDGIPDEKRSRIPILLVQRPGRRECQLGKLGLGSGWDIISPAGFGMAIWLSLIFRGARTGGLRESELLRLECNSLQSSPQPDSTSGETESREKKEKLREKYFKLPPNKRANFVKLGVVSPFCCPWRSLVRDWQLDRQRSENQKFSVLRDQKVLKELHALVAKRRRSTDFRGYLTEWSDALVPVVVEYSGKGKPEDFALICVPREEDFSEELSNPIELSHEDENEKLRKMLKLEHSKVLISLGRRRKKDRRKLKEDFANNVPGKLKWRDIVNRNAVPSETASEQFRLKMEALWLPEREKPGSVRQSTCREVAGFVTKGGFSFSKSLGLALGYVTLPSFLQILKVSNETKTRLTVLVRNRNHTQYKFAKVTIAMD